MISCLSLLSKLTPFVCVLLILNICKSSLLVVILSDPATSGLMRFCQSALIVAVSLLCWYIFERAQAKTEYRVSRWPYSSPSQGSFLRSLEWPWKSPYQDFCSKIYWLSDQWFMEHTPDSTESDCTKWWTKTSNHIQAWCSSSPDPSHQSAGPLKGAWTLPPPLW